MRKIIMILLFTTLLSCGDNECKKYYIGDVTLYEKFKYEGKLKSKPLIAADSFLYGGIYVFDSLLITRTSKNSEGIICIYNFNTLQKLLTICKKGKGNNEYFLQFKNDPPFICPETKHIKMNTYNGTLSYIQVDITESLAQGRMIVSESKNYKDKYFRQLDYTSKVTELPDKGRLIVSSAYQSDIRDKEYTTPKFVLENRAGNSKEIVIFPEPIYVHDDDLNIEFYRSNYIVKPDGSKIAYAMMMTDLLSITDLKTGKTKGFQSAGSIKFTDIIHYSRDKVREQFAYNHCISANDNYIFAVNLNMRHMDGDYEEVNPKPSLRIFSWDGEPLAKIEIGEEGYVREPFLDEKTNRLYLANGESDIIYYDLTEVFKKIKE